MEIGLHRNDIEIQDVIGPCGVPKHTGGFKVGVGVTPNGENLTIDPGRIYVDGILCELEERVFYTSQPDYPNPEYAVPVGSPPSDTPQLNLPDGDYLVYLDVWRREINALDDSDIREKALGGPDTTTRLKTVWQVKLWPVANTASSPPTSPPSNSNCDTPFPEWVERITAPTGSLYARTAPSKEEITPCLLPPKAGFARLENQLYTDNTHKLH